ncbi:hypothetical protein AVEN_169322-1, partial [Araneus ventricosus]
MDDITKVGGLDLHTVAVYNTAGDDAPSLYCAFHLPIRILTKKLLI